MLGECRPMAIVRSGIHEQRAIKSSVGPEVLCHSFR